jgi:hypothetical protein
MKRIALIQIALILCFVTLQVSDCRASSGDVGTSSAQFLKLGLGGRALALGGAFVGLANDVTAIHWNPAGLADISATEFCLMHRSLFQNISHEYIAYAQPLGGRGTLGAGIAYMHMDQLVGRDEFGEFTSDFSSSDIAIMLSYALQANRHFFLGTSVKYVTERIENYDAHALAFDLGWLYRTPLDELQLGGTIQNLGQDMKFVSESSVLPRLIKLGVAYSNALGRGEVNAALDIYLPSDESKNLHFGIEYVYNDLIAARIGYNGNSLQNSDSKLSLGIGLIIKRNQTYRLDYSYLPQAVLGDSHTISLLIHL